MSSESVQGRLDDSVCELYRMTVAIARKITWPSRATALLSATFLAHTIPADRIGLPQTAPSDVLLVLALGVGLAEAIRFHGCQPLRSWPVAMGSVALALAAVSAMNVADVGSTLQNLVRLTEMFLFFPVAFLLAIRSSADLCWLVVVMALVVGFESAVGITQSLTGTGALYAGETIRAVGTFGAANINALGALSVIGLVFGLACLQFQALWLRSMGAAYTALSLGAIVFSMSRGAWITAAAVTLLILSRAKLRRGLLVGALGVVVAGFALSVASHTGGAVAERAASIVEAQDTPDQAVIDRLTLWEAARAMIEDHPWFGVGPGQFSMQRDGYSSLALLGSSDIGGVGAFERQAILSPHNMYYFLASGLGIPAGVLLALMAVAALVVGTLRLRRTPRTDLLLWLGGAMACGSVLTVLIGGLSEDFGGPTSIFIGWGLGLACWWAAQDTLQPSAAVGPGARATGTSERSTEVRDRRRRRGRHRRSRMLWLGWRSKGVGGSGPPQEGDATTQGTQVRA